MHIEHAFETAMRDAGGFEPAPHIAVAVSGGSDSMALTLLAQAWVLARGGKITALIVDHQLREESTREAHAVAQELLWRGIPSEILTLEQKISGAAVQEQARTLRYNSLFTWCQRNGVLHVMLGHHADDQRETMVMRLTRGVGLHGLCGMNAVSYRNQLRLLRPLLSVTKSDCVDYLHAQKMPWFEDPTNQKPIYQRNRVRSLIPLLDAQGWSAERSIKLVDNLQRSESFIAKKLCEWLAEYAVLHPAGIVSVSLSAFDLTEDEMCYRIVSSCLISIYSGKAELRSEDVMSLVAALRKRNDYTPRTLNGCLVLVDNLADNIVFCREIARVEKPLRLDNKAMIFWDNRYRIEVLGDCNPPCAVGVLGASGVAWLRRNRVLLPRLPVQALRTFPAFWTGEALDCLVAVPHMGYYGDESFAKSVQIVWTPARALAQ